MKLKKTWHISFIIKNKQTLKYESQRFSYMKKHWAQANLRLRWAHMPLCWFCHEAAHCFILSVRTAETRTWPMACTPINYFWILQYNS